jgi:hypothetical protein
MATISVRSSLWQLHLPCLFCFTPYPSSLILETRLLEFSIVSASKEPSLLAGLKKVGKRLREFGYGKQESLQDLIQIPVPENNKSHTH